MKHCPTCNSQYTDVTLKFCMQDGAPLMDAPRYDPEAETLKNQPRKPEMSTQDAIMEIADYLRRVISPGAQALIRFEPLTGLGLTVEQISKHFIAAAEKADCEVIDKTDTRATVRREPARLIRG